MQQIALLTCSAADPDDCLFSSSSGGIWQLSLIFCGAQLILCQVKSLHDAWWVSTLGTLGSIVNCLVCMGLCLANASNGLGGVEGIPIGSLDSSGNVVSTSDKVSNYLDAFQVKNDIISVRFISLQVGGVLNALGSISFAYSFQLILLEIQDTVMEPPKSLKTMKIASNIAITATFFFYFGIGVAGYAAEGNTVTGIILQSFDGPEWALILGNVAVLREFIGTVRDSPPGVTGSHIFPSRNANLTFLPLNSPYVDRILDLCSSCIQYDRVSLQMGLHPPSHKKGRAGGILCRKLRRKRSIHCCDQG